jgi:hypothetical protein
MAMLIRGLVLYLKKSKLGEDVNLAAKLGNKWYLQIHEAILHCSSCGKKLTEKDVKINTQKCGLLCAGCWAKKMGKHVEKHPISD